MRAQPEVKIWFRLTFDERGAMLTCDAVEKPGVDGVMYVQAIDAKQAHRIAARQYGKMKVRERRSRYIAKGLCSECGNPPATKIDGTKTRRCRRCLILNESHQRRSEQRAAGAKIEPLPAGGKPAKEAQEKRDQVTRLETLLWVERLWLDSANTSSFGKAISRKILELKAQLQNPQQQLRRTG